MFFILRIIIESLMKEIEFGRILKGKRSMGKAILDRAK